MDGRIHTLHVFPDAARLRAHWQGPAASLAPGTQALAWEAWVGALAQPLLRGMRPSTPLLSRGILASLTASWSEAGTGRLAEPSFSRAVLRTLRELKGAEVDARSLQEAAEFLAPESRPRLRELAQWLHRYEEVQGRLGVWEPEDLWGKARRALAQGLWPTPWVHLRQLVLHGVYDLSAAAMSWLLTLAQVCQQRSVQLRVLTPTGGSVPADAALVPLFKAFEARSELLPQVDVQKEDLSFEGRPFAPWALRLFGAPASASAEASVDASALKMFSASNTREEARQVAREIRSLLAQGTPPSQIAIAYRRAGPELPALAEALNALGIAWRSEQGWPLSALPPVREALQLPELVEAGYPAAGMEGTVRRLFERALGEGAASGNRWSAGSLFHQAGIRDDRLGRSKGRGAYDLRLEQWARLAQHRHPEASVAAQRLRESCLQLIATGASLPDESSVPVFLDAWWRGVQGLKLLEPEPLPQGLEGAVLRAAQKAEALQTRARGALERRVKQLFETAAMLGEGPKLTRALFGSWLKEAFRDLALPMASDSEGAVWLLEAGQLEGRTFDYVFLGGMVEGRFPGVPEADPLLRDSERVALNQHWRRDAFRISGGEFEQRTPWTLAEDRLLFAGVLGVPRQRLCLSYARTGEQGEALTASAFLEELVQLTGIPCESRSLSSVPPLDEVATESEFRQRVLLEALVPVRQRLELPDPAAACLSLHLGKEPWFQRAQQQLEVELERQRFFADADMGVGAFSGAVAHPAVGQRFAFSAQAPLSASTLALFGNCGFQGFLAVGLKLPSHEEWGEELDARTRGTYWHRVLEELFKRMGEEARSESDPRGRALPETLLDESLEAASRALAARSHLGHPLLWRLARQRARAMAARLLETKQRGLPFEGFTPRRFEWKFGPGAQEAPWRSVVIPGTPPIHLEGKIDRLDARGSEVAVVDYKSGMLEKRELKARLLVTDFQLPIYLHAARASGQDLARRAAWFSMRTGDAIFLDALLPADQLEDLLSLDLPTRARLREEGGWNLANAVEGLVQQMRAGQFPARARDCTHCSFRAVCRIGQRPLDEEAG